MTRVLIFGTGAVGCVYGYILQKGGAEVVAVCRSTYTAIKERGVTIHSELYGETVHYDPYATVKSVAEAMPHGPFDYVFVCSKAFPGLASQIGEAVTPERTAIVLAQNGIGIEDEYRQAYPQSPIISGVVWVPASQTSPGVVWMGGVERFEIGTFPADAPQSHVQKAQRLSEVWKAGGGNCRVYADIQLYRWNKLALNVAFNPSCALSRCDNANFLLSSDDADGFVVQIIKQVGKVAQAACGYTHLLEDKFINETMAFHRSLKTKGGRDPSMLTDVKMGQAIEVDVILGNMVRMARKHQVEVPYLECLYVLARGLNFGVVKPEGRWREPLA